MQSRLLFLCWQKRDLIRRVSLVFETKSLLINLASLWTHLTGLSYVPCGQSPEWQWPKKENLSGLRLSRIVRRGRWRHTLNKQGNRTSASSRRHRGTSLHQGRTDRHTPCSRAHRRPDSSTACSRTPSCSRETDKWVSLYSFMDTAASSSGLHSR